MTNERISEIAIEDVEYASEEDIKKYLENQNRELYEFLREDSTLIYNFMRQSDNNTVKKWLYIERGNPVPSCADTVEIREFFNMQQCEIEFLRKQDPVLDKKYLKEENSGAKNTFFKKPSNNSRIELVHIFKERMINYPFASINGLALSKKGEIFLIEKETKRIFKMGETSVTSPNVLKKEGLFVKGESIYSFDFQNSSERFVCGANGINLKIPFAGWDDYAIDKKGMMIYFCDFKNKKIEPIAFKPCENFHPSPVGGIEGVVISKGSFDTKKILFLDKEKMDERKGSSITTLGFLNPKYSKEIGCPKTTPFAGYKGFFFDPCEEKIFRIDSKKRRIHKVVSFSGSSLESQALAGVKGYILGNKDEIWRFNGNNLKKLKDIEKVNFEADYDFSLGEYGTLTLSNMKGYMLHKDKKSILYFDKEKLSVGKVGEFPIKVNGNESFAGIEGLVLGEDMRTLFRFYDK